MATTTENAVTLAPEAAAKLREVLSVQRAFPEGAGLRVGVLDGGPVGFRYHLTLDVPGEDDVVFTQDDDLRVLVDRESLRYVAGSTITLVDEPGRVAFDVDNPRAEPTCGCRTSFRLRDEQ
jgi:iron-sulfur cluster assembly accessory protein